MDRPDAGNLIQATLQHHGVLGMKWGRRRTRAQIDAAGASSDHSTTQFHIQSIKKGGGTHVLANHELQAVITRMNLEQQYSRLSSERSNLSKSQKFIKSTLSVGRTVQDVHQFLNGPLGKEVKKALADAKK